MSIFDDFSNKWNALGQTMPGSKPQKKKRPQTMQEWGTYVNGLSRPERDQQYPGMHKDLIPSYEMITGGDPNWGSAVGTGTPTGAGAFEQEMSGGNVDRGWFPWPSPENQERGRKEHVRTGANGSFGRKVDVGTITPSNGVYISFGPRHSRHRNREYYHRIYLDGRKMGADSDHVGPSGHSIPATRNGTFKVEVAFMTKGDFFEIEYEKS